METTSSQEKTTSKEVVLSIATNETTVANFRRLVVEQYGMRDWLDEKQQEEGTIADKFDTGSDVLVVQSGNETIAGMRIVKDVGHGFPHEELLGLSQFTKDGYYENDILRKLAHTPRDKMAEITKLVGKKRQRFLTFDLAKCIYWYAIHNEIEIYLMVVDMEFFLLCDKLGVPINPIGVPILCEGSWTIPAVIAPIRFEKEI